MHGKVAPHFERPRLTGERLHLVMLVAAAIYIVTHLVLGRALMTSDAPFAALFIGLTVMTALGNLFVAVPVWVYAATVLIRGPRSLVSLPTSVSDEELPDIVVQVPGRHEPLSEVQRSIDSVLRADYPHDKLRVQFVDNSDDERWREVAAAYADEARVSVEHREGTRGFKGGNLNHGLARLAPFKDAKHQLIGLLDVGDTFAPKVLRPMATEFVHDRKLGFVQDMFRIGNPNDTIINWSDGYAGDAARRFTEGCAAHYGIPTLNGHCALIRMEALDAIGRWDDARVAEDWSTGIRMLAQGWRGKWVDYDPNDPDMVSTELVPGDISAQQKQKRRWATGGTELARLHLGEWLRSPIPWHQRLALLLRLGANVTVIPNLLSQLIFPIWLALALLGEVPSGTVSFGILSIGLQNPFFMANLAGAINYAREGRWQGAGAVLLSYPVQALWRLPLLVHACLGFVEGLTAGLKTFVITPKLPEEPSVMDILRSQRLVIGVSLLPSVPLLVVLVTHPDRLSAVALAVLSLPAMTVGALLMVPSTQWLRARLGYAHQEWA